MINNIKYPKIEKLIEHNILAVTVIKAKKADTAKVLSIKKLREIIEECENKEGNIYDKAVVLLKGIIQKHPFASGNRRTALVAVKDFLSINRTKFRVNDNPHDAGVMQGIRENYYSDEEIKEWIEHGRIRKFGR